MLDEWGDDLHTPRVSRAHALLLENVHTTASELLERAGVSVTRHGAGLGSRLAEGLAVQRGEAAQGGDGEVSSSSKLKGPTWLLTPTAATRRSCLRGGR